MFSVNRRTQWCFILLGGYHVRGFILKTDVGLFFETLMLLYQTTWLRNPKDHNFDTAVRNPYLIAFIKHEKKLQGNLKLP
jgi:hypothetical protein